MSTYSRRVVKPKESRNRNVDSVNDSLAKPKPKPKPKPKEGQVSSVGNNKNRLLAGYLAHEFVTQGTLFGQKWDPARAEAAPLSSESNKTKRRARAEPPPVKRKCYEEVASLLKSEDAQITGVVNPSQLVRWLQM